MQASQSLIVLCAVMLWHVPRAGAEKMYFHGMWRGPQGGIAVIVHDTDSGVMALRWDGASYAESVNGTVHKYKFVAGDLKGSVLEFDALSSTLTAQDGRTWEYVSEKEMPHGLWRSQNRTVSIPITVSRYDKAEYKCGDSVAKRDGDKLIFGHSGWLANETAVVTYGAEIRLRFQSGKVWTFEPVPSMEGTWSVRGQAAPEVLTHTSQTSFKTSGSDPVLFTIEGSTINVVPREDSSTPPAFETGTFVTNNAAATIVFNNGAVWERQLRRPPQTSTQSQ